MRGLHRCGVLAVVLGLAVFAGAPLLAFAAETVLLERVGQLDGGGTASGQHHRLRAAIGGSVVLGRAVGSKYVLVAGFGLSPPDRDGDGIPDYKDPDSDNDGVDDASDNCPHAANPSQRDSDGDGVGDACENDPDGDGYPDEAGPAARDPNSYPGAPEVCDGADNDGDGLVDEGTGCEVCQ
jgi:hypothetical protein